MNKFSFDTIDDFDNHIKLSIPNYEDLTEQIISIGSYFLKNGSKFYDFGCSTGALIDKIKKRYENVNVKFIGVDNSFNMSKRKDFIINEDLTKFKPLSHNFSVFIFTLQFIPLKHRLSIIRNVYKSLDDGGCVVIAEKILLNDSFFQEVVSFCYYDFKKLSFSEKEILNKQLDLRYIMRPLTENENIDIFKKAGFKKIQPFWQSLQFKAWILIK